MLINDAAKLSGARYDNMTPRLRKHKIGVSVCLRPTPKREGRPEPRKISERPTLS